MNTTQHSEFWISINKRFNEAINTFNFQTKISPFLLNQKTLLTLAKINGLCDFKVDNIFEVIKKLEGIPCRNSTDLIKHNIEFSKNGILQEYKHHHVPLLPNSYLAMLARVGSNNNFINLDATLNSISFPNGQFEFDFNYLENEIKSRGSKKPGRLTGHWLISKIINGENIYLGIFPHSNGNLDDLWIKRQLLESERVFNFSKKI